MHLFQLISLLLYAVLAAGAYGDDDTIWTPRPRPNQPPHIAAMPLMAPSENGNSPHIKTRLHRRARKVDKTLLERSPRRRPHRLISQKGSVTCYRAMGGMPAGSQPPAPPSQPPAPPSQPPAPSIIGMPDEPRPPAPPSFEGMPSRKPHPASPSGVCGPR